MEEYPNARKQEFADHPFAAWVRHDLPSIFAAAAPGYPSIVWVASPGQGQWADAPWIAALDPLVTETAQEGYYPVYLFTRSLDGVYLSLNQGMAHLRDELGAQAKATLAYRASILRARLYPAYEERFAAAPVDLQPEGSQTRLAFYEPGHAFGVGYSRVALPAENDLKDDLLYMLLLYERATVLGGNQELDTTGHAIADQGEEHLAQASLEEKRRLRFHFRYRCQACGYDFQREFGELGRGYIEAHHLTPLAALPPSKPVSLSPKKDFAVLCANCHRMIHRPGAPATLEEFRKLYPITLR
jgi:5-methylcytosine-specific restriction protein A